MSMVPMPEGFDPRTNDAVWARFYRDGANLAEIAAEFGGGIYDYSPWLYRPLLRDDARVPSASLPTTTETGK